MQMIQIQDGLKMTSLFLKVKLGMVTYACGAHTLKAEAGGLP